MEEIKDFITFFFSLLLLFKKKIFYLESYIKLRQIMNIDMQSFERSISEFFFKLKNKFLFSYY